MSRSRRVILTLALIALLAALGGCAPGSGRFSPAGPAGFWAGLWHGAISLVTLVVSFFSDTVRMYETFNRGPLYDLGFLLGVLIVWGGIFHGHHRRRWSCR